MVFARATVTECLICTARKKRPGVRVTVEHDDELDYCEGCISRLYAVLTAPNAREPDAPRALSVIAAEIKKDWAKVPINAEPYLRAMKDLNDVEEKFGHDSGKDIVRRFLCNASLWKGPVARRVKRELKELLS
jgi:hypothetical protein